MGRKVKMIWLTLVTIILIVSSSIGQTMTAFAATAYDASAALAYAEAHWDDGQGLCAEFVSQCIKAGGSTAWSASCTALRSQLLSSGWGTEYELALQSDMSIKASDYTGKLAPGDVVFYYCPGCTDGKPYIHAVLCNGMDANGYMKAYSHNNANSGQAKYRYGSTCYSCGTKLNKAYVYHFTNTVNDPEGVVDVLSGGAGKIYVKGWTFDRDNLSKALELHVYIGGPAGAGFRAYPIFASKERTDVNDTYPGVGNYHGFEEYIEIPERGDVPIYIYSLNVGSGDNVLLGSATVRVTDSYSIKFSSSELDVRSGESNAMGIKFAGDGIYTMTYNIEDTNVCGASWGSVNWSTGETSLVLKGKKAGSTNVTVNLLDRNSSVLYSSSFKATVGVERGTLSISAEYLELEKSTTSSQKATLSWTGCNNVSEVAVSFSNSNVVDVSVGQINNNTVTLSYSPKDVGKTQIKYRLLDTYGNDVGVTSNVVEVKQNVTGVNLNQSSITLEKGNSYALVATVQPSNAENKAVSWKSSNTAVATVNGDGVVNAVGSGTATITVSSSNGITASCIVTVREKTVVDTGKAQIVVSNSSGMASQQVDVTISLKNNPGFVSMMLGVDYDPTVLTLVNVSDGGKLGTAVHSDNMKACPYTLTWANDLATEDYIYNGEIVTLTFEIKEDAKEMTIPIVVNYDYDNYDIFNADGKSVYFETVVGSVSVTDVLIGDVNNDGKVNTQDRMVLTRYLAKWTGYTADTVNATASDVNGDGKVNTQDRMILTRYLAKWTGYEAIPYHG